MIGFALTFRPQPISIFWPPNSILLGALLLAPPRWWWLFLLSALPAHLTAEMQSGVPTAMVLAWFVSSCCEALIGAAAVRRLVSGELRFDCFRLVSLFLFLCAFLAPFLSSFLDAALVKIIGWENRGDNRAGNLYQYVRHDLPRRKTPAGP
jgi:two-component system sensor kinase FixL